MVTRDETIEINGHLWTKCSGTTAGATYPLRDILACGGQKPWIVSVESSDESRTEGDE